MKDIKTRKAFTLMEILVVIVIIVILIGLMIPFVARMGENAKRSAMSINMQTLHQAEEVYHRNFPERLNHMDAEQFFLDADGDESPDRPLTSSEYFCLQIGLFDESKLTLDIVDDEIVRELHEDANVLKLLPNGGYSLYVIEAPFYGLYDFWGNELEYRTQNREDSDNDGTPDDADVPTYSSYITTPEYKDALPYHEWTCFSSPGGDGLWGALSNGALLDRTGDARDNIYSIEDTE